MQNRQPQKLAINPNLLLQTSENLGTPINSSKRRRNVNQAFITQKPQGPFGKVNEYHNKLNSEIDNMDQKIQKLIQKHQAEFILAYRNHVKKVRQEMDEIRKRANSNSEISSTQKVQLLQKQLAIFRQESLGLFDKITVRQLELYQARNRISELQTEKKFNQDTIKKLMKRTKLLEASQISRGLDHLSSQNIQIRQNPTQNLYPSYRKDVARTGSVSNGDLKMDAIQSRPFTTAIGSRSRRPHRSNKQKSLYIRKPQQQGQTEFFNRLKEIVGYQNMKQVNQICKLFEEYTQKIKSTSNEPSTNIQTSYNIPSGFNYRDRKNSTGQYWKTNLNFSKDLQIKSHSTAKKSQLEEFFYTCIQNVRKQIMRRKNIRSLNFYFGQQMNLQQFKKIDAFRLIEMLVSNQKIIAGLHAMIFGEKTTFFKQ